MQIVVWTQSGKTFTLELLPSVTVKRVKELIQYKEGTKIMRQRILYDGALPQWADYTVPLSN